MKVDITDTDSTPGLGRSPGEEVVTPVFLPSSDGKASACDAGEPGSIPGLGRSPGEGKGNSLQYSCLENSMDGGAWWATVHGVAKSQTRLSNFATAHGVTKSRTGAN